MSINGTAHSLSFAWVGVSSPPPVNNGQSSQLFRWTTIDNILAHEFGHTLGVVHAGAWHCESVRQIYSNCENLEYGHEFDVMGSGFYSLHFNSYFKDIFGWTTGRSQTIQTSGIYTLNPLESGSGIVSTRIVNPAIPDASFYSLEYRKGIGFDAALTKANGLIIQWVPKEYSQFLSQSLSVRLLDMDASSAEYALPVGGSYTDPGRGVTLTVLEKTDQDISFSVDIQDPVCVRANLLIDSILFSNNLSTVPGSRFPIAYFIQNIDSPTCPMSTIEISVDGIPLEWTIFFPFGSSSTYLPDNADGRYGLVLFDIPLSATPGTYGMTLNFKNIDSGRTESRKIGVVVSGSSSPILDIDGNGRFDYYDYILLGKIIVDTAVCPQNCDLNGDGKVSVIDLIMLASSMTKKYDLTGDQKINVADSLKIENFIKFRQPDCPASPCDLTDDGKVDVTDMMRLRLYLSSVYDLNDDHAFNQQDYDLLRQIVAGNVKCPANRSCDLNVDNAVNALDIIYLNRYLQGI